MSRFNIGSPIIKSKNAKLILKEIKEKMQTTRAEISKSLGITAPTVSNNVEYLIKNKFIDEYGKGDSSGGRKPVVLKFNYSSFHVIAINLEHNKLHGCVSDLKGNTIYKNNCNNLYSNMDLDQAVLELTKLINDLIKGCKIERSTIKVIVITLPGIISDNNILVSNVFPKFQGTDLYIKLLKKTKINILLKNDVNSKMLGEFWDLPINYKNIIYISSEETGVGSGIIIDGKLYEGSHFAAGEVGHMVLQDCNSKTDIHYFEEVVSDEYLLKLIISESKRWNLPISEYTVNSGNKLSIDFSKIKFQVLKNDKVAINIYDHVAKYYSIAIHNLYITLNPDIIILGGNLVHGGKVLLDYIYREVSKYALLPVKLKYGNEGKNIKMYGAVYTGINFIEKQVIGL